MKSSPGLLQSPVETAPGLVDTSVVREGFYPDYSDMEEYFDRVGETLGLGAPGNRSGNTPPKGVRERETLDVP